MPLLLQAGQWVPPHPQCILPSAGTPMELFLLLVALAAKSQLLLLLLLPPYVPTQDGSIVVVVAAVNDVNGDAGNGDGLAFRWHFRGRLAWDVVLVAIASFFRAFCDGVLVLLVVVVVNVDDAVAARGAFVVLLLLLLLL